MPLLASRRSLPVIKPITQRLPFSNCPYTVRDFPSKYLNPYHNSPFKHRPFLSLQIRLKHETWQNKETYESFCKSVKLNFIKKQTLIMLPISEKDMKDIWYLHPPARFLLHSFYLLLHLALGTCLSNSNVYKDRWQLLQIPASNLELILIRRAQTAPSLLR